MLPLRAPIKAWAPLYKSGYALWEQVWLGVHKRFQVPTPFFMDGLMRHDEGEFIFKGNECVAILLFRTYDFDLLNFRRDSYFKEFTDLDMQRVLNGGKRVFAATYLTVNPAYRGFHPDVRFKQVLMNIMIRRFLESDAHVIMNVARRDRDLNHEAMALGGIMLRENVDYFSGREKVDLIYYTRQSAHESNHPVMRPFVDELWTNRRDWKHLQPAASGKAA
jgi:hypothetical protein